MSMVLQGGDYVPDGSGGFRGNTEQEALLQRVLLRLSARRGGFAPLPDFGSRLYRLPTERASRRAELSKQYVEEALSEETGLMVQEVEWREAEGVLVAHLSFCEERFQVSFAPEAKGGL